MKQSYVDTVSILARLVKMFLAQCDYLRDKKNDDSLQIFIAPIFLQFREKIITYKFETIRKISIIVDNVQNI